MYKNLRCRITKKHWRMFSNTMGKVYRKLSSKGNPMKTYIFNYQDLEVQKKKSTEFYPVLK